MSKPPIYFFGELDEEIHTDQLEGFHSTGSGEKVYQLKDVQLWTTAVCPSMEQATA